MIAFPETTTPEELAEKIGWSARRVRETARRLAACRIMGNRMVLLQRDVDLIMLSFKPNMSGDGMGKWFAEDLDDLRAEREYQDTSFGDVGLVYFVLRSDEVKIGFTTNLEKRINAFKTATSEDLTVVLVIEGTPDLESYFHEKFQSAWIKREWFKYTEEIRCFVARRNRRYDRIYANEPRKAMGVFRAPYSQHVAHWRVAVLPVR